MPKLKVGVLTTDTPHHRYFLRRLWMEAPAGVTICLNLFEERAYPWRRRARRHAVESLPNLRKGLLENPYVRSKRFEREQLQVESASFFNGGDDQLPDDLETHTVHSVNDDVSRSLIERQEPDVLLVYGTGLVSPDVFSWPRLGTLNAHGGLLPGYRGLDTNLWAAYLGRPEDMAVSIHEVEREFDTGRVVAQAPIPRADDLGATTLRYHSAVVATDLYIQCIHHLVGGALIPIEHLTERADAYFGPMPARFKRKADMIIRQHVRQSEGQRS